MDHRKRDMLIGPLLADAAGLGLHWLYDVDRIEQVAARHGSSAFVPVDPANYEGVAGYFAHGARPAGGLSQYGETLRLCMESLVAIGAFELEDQQARFAAHFDAGGAYSGYIDRPTRGVLDNLRAGQSKPSGIDDDQLPGITRVPALVATGGELKPAVTMTSTHSDMLGYAQIIATILRTLLDGQTMAQALEAGLHAAPNELKSPLEAALQTDETNSVIYGETTQRACHLPQALPLAFHILRYATSFEEAVETNIRAGGDSAGRAMIIGAGAGAAYGLYTPWLLKMRDANDLWSMADSLSTATGALHV